MTDFKGITTVEIVKACVVLKNDGAVEREDALKAIHFPPVHSWRLAVNNLPPSQQMVWCARPDGQWIAIMRYAEELIVTDANIPVQYEVEGELVDVDFAEIHRMLSYHRSILYCMNGTQGLVGIAVQRKGQSVTPLIPGFFATPKTNIQVMDAEELVQLRQEQAWPIGLVQPWILGADKLSAISDADHRAHYVSQTPNGLWLLTVGGKPPKLDIFEVRA